MDDEHFIISLFFFLLSVYIDPNVVWYILQRKVRAFPGAMLSLKYQNLSIWIGY